MIRFIIASIWVVVFLIISIPIILIEWLIGLIWPRAKAVSSQWIVVRAFRVVLFISGTRIKVKGLENIPADRAVLYVPNHRSIFDIVVPYCVFPGQTGYIAKKETRRVPVFNVWMAFMNCQFLNRSDLRDGLRGINKSAELIEQGVSMCVFPEGTRNKSENALGPFHDGSLKVAQKAECPIVPLAIVGTADIFENHFPKVKRTTVTLEFCEPIETRGMSRAEFRDVSQRVQDAITAAYEANKNPEG